MENYSGISKGAIIGVVSNLAANYISFGSWQIENVIIGLIVGAVLGKMFLR